VSDPDERKPLLRGYLHLGAAFAAVVGLVALMLLADTPKEYVGGAVFAASLVLLYATSATYHIINWGRRMHGVLMRLDHSMIFVLIAGSYTPVCLLALSGAIAIGLLVLVWSIAVAGIVLKVTWPSAPRWLGVACYIAAGWIFLVAVTEIKDTLALVPAVLLLTGGLCYTAGGVIYALRRPNPFPRVFGYHEVFHALTIVGGAAHFAVVAYLMPA